MDNRHLKHFSGKDKSRISRQKPDAIATVLQGRSMQIDSKHKALLRLILDHGASYEQIARLSGEHAGTVSRRFRAMVRRLRGRPPRPAETVSENLTPLEKTILIESFVCGTSQTAIAAKLGISRYRVRKALALFGRQEAAGNGQ